jgi:hypothetical protein
MLTKTITVNLLYSVSSVLTNNQKWNAAGSWFRADSSGERVLAVFAMISLIIAMMLLFWLFYRYRCSEQKFRQKLSELETANIKLKRKNTELAAAVEKLRLEHAGL